MRKLSSSKAESWNNILKISYSFTRYDGPKSRKNIDGVALIQFFFLVSFFAIFLERVRVGGGGYREKWRTQLLNQPAARQAGTPALCLIFIRDYYYLFCLPMFFVYFYSTSYCGFFYYRYHATPTSYLPTINSTNTTNYFNIDTVIYARNNLVSKKKNIDRAIYIIYIVYIVYILRSI